MPRSPFFGFHTSGVSTTSLDGRGFGTLYGGSSTLDIELDSVSVDPESLEALHGRISFKYMDGNSLALCENAFLLWAVQDGTIDEQARR